MQINSLFAKLTTMWIVGTSVMLFLFAASARAQRSSGTYAFVVASGFLCEGGGSGSCPAVAESPAGDSYEISGARTFDSQKRSAKAAGTFTHKSINGNVIETGVWVASDLISFRSYGVAPAALMQKGPTFGRTQIGLKRLPFGSRVLPTGGLAVLRISFLPIAGPTKTAILQLNCAWGDVPRERSIEGVRLSFDGAAAEFTEQAEARVIFLSMRAQVRGTGAAQQARTPDSPATSPR
jgi:hypothetical protein